MTKPLDKHTKAELLAHLRAQALRLGALELEATQLRADKARLQQDLEALETRRKYEAAAYAAKLRKTKSGNPTHVDCTCPHQDASEPLAQHARHCPVHTRMNWAALAKQYCTQFGVSSVSRTDLVRFAENART